MHESTRRTLTITLLVAAFLLLGAAATPALAQNRLLLKRASDFKNLGTATIAPGDSGDVLEITKEAANAGVYQIPNTRVLVIRRMIVFPETPGAGTLQVQFIQDNKARSFWVLPNDRPTQLQFEPGMVIEPGVSMSFNNLGAAGDFSVELYGYVSRDR